MRYAIAVVLVVLWLAGVLNSYTLGGAIHVLVLIAIGLIVANFLSPRGSL
jgi:hypothetical protein